MDTAATHLSQGASDNILAIDYTKQTALAALSQVDHIFTDADGTIVQEGAEQFLPDKIDCITKITQCGIGVTVVTGKPIAEAAPLRQTLPPNVPISFICEKGAYSVHFDQTGAWREFILSSAEQEASVADLREQFNDFSKQLVKEHGAHVLGFGWGGSGEHKSALSIDIFSGAPPKGYLALRGAKRDAIKLKDPVLLAQVEQAITDWAHKNRPGWRVVHLGNANTEITPEGTSKSEAIIESSEFGAARSVLLLGDSLNDREMFSLRKTFNGKAHTGLVLHRTASLPLVDNADFVTFGMANCNPLLHAVIHAHQSRV